MQLNADSSDIDVMKRVAAYDSKALEILYNRYAPLLYTLIKKIVVDKKLAELWFDDEPSLARAMGSSEIAAATADNRNFLNEERLQIFVAEETPIISER